MKINLWRVFQTAPNHPYGDFGSATLYFPTKALAHQWIREAVKFHIDHQQKIVNSRLQPDEDGWIDRGFLQSDRFPPRGKVTRQWLEEEAKFSVEEPEKVIFSDKETLCAILSEGNGEPTYEPEVLAFCRKWRK